MYDTRMAQTIARAKKFYYRRPLSKRDEALLRAHAKQIAKTHPEAMLVRFHRRRRLTEWATTVEVQYVFGVQKQAGNPIVLRGEV